ncbi:hypothetical protein NLJ89_g7272 [Agrocybe chaxingu]|uniref:Deoxyribonuclease NucA/NucB domain-containing protein n=1 Tax=Agrocybe chaxingu TaxID=84603 RepID=A0A9W8MRX3_9AGAR|nr:hypothetical protein NLJ89_g7272 [Agrocybe chaxingu]
MNSLDYNKVYAPMVGSCAFDPNGCPVTWTDFVNYFYNTIQATLAMDWPTSGDAVLAWWAEIANWTGFCSGTNCVNGRIPYTNLNDWLRFSSEVLVTTPGSPPIRDPLSPVRDENEDAWDPVPNGPCPYADSSLCGYDDGPQEPPEADSASFAVSSTSAGPKPNFATLSLTHGDRSALVQSSSIADDLLPRNVPPPVYITNGTDRVAVDLNLDGGSPPTRRSLSIVKRSVNSTLLQHRAPPAPSKDDCKGDTDIPSPLPILTYYCDYLPDICANIRSSGLLANDEMILTYDSFGTGKRRNGICDAPRRAALRSGGCDRTQHDPAYWKVSCDEFPFNQALEGGRANGAVTAGVPTQEQNYQSGLQSAVAALYRVKGDNRSIWSRPRNVKRPYPGMCHQYIIKLVNTRPGIPSRLRTAGRGPHLPRVHRTTIPTTP